MQRCTVKDWVAEFLQVGLGMTPQAGLARRSGDSMVALGQDGLPGNPLRARRARLTHEHSGITAA